MFHETLSFIFSCPGPTNEVCVRKSGKLSFLSSKEFSVYRSTKQLEDGDTVAEGDKLYGMWIGKWDFSIKVIEIEIVGPQTIVPSLVYV